jgi:hypothetical protein
MGLRVAAGQDSKSEYTQQELKDFQEIFEWPAMRHASREDEDLAHDIRSYWPRGKYEADGDHPFQVRDGLLRDVGLDEDQVLLHQHTDILGWGHQLGHLPAHQQDGGGGHAAQTFKFMHHLMIMLCAQNQNMGQY